MILHRAFVAESLRACAAVSVILLGIFLAVRGLGFLRQAAEGDIPAGSVLLLLALKTITYLDIIVPLALYIAALAVLGRWLRDREMLIIAASGVGGARLLRPAAWLFALIGGGAALCSLYLSPLAAESARAIIHDARSRADLAAVLPGVFTEGRDGSVYFVERYDGDVDGDSVDGGDGAGGDGGLSRHIRSPRLTMRGGDESGGGDGDVAGDSDGNAGKSLRNLFVYHRGAGDGGQDGVVVAKRGRIVADAGGEFLVLEDGSRIIGAAGDAAHATLDFETYRLRLTPPSAAGDSQRLPVEAQSTAALWRADTAAARGELHWRFSKAAMLAALLVFALAFSSLATFTARTRRLPGMLAALLVYFAYSNVLGLAAAQVSRGASPVMLWSVHLIFLATALYLLHRRHFDKPLLPRRAG